MVEKNLAGLDWNALLQKAEEGIKILEEESDFMVPGQTPMTGIEEMAGVSHAYYEKLEAMGKLLEECDALMNQKVTPTPPIEVSRTESTPEEKDKELAMGFTRCSNCGAKVHDFQRACPQCGGREFSEEDEVKRLEEEIASLEGEA
jgi:predicted Zn-ribbon and HTH transcriptional regulator